MSITHLTSRDVRTTSKTSRTLVLKMTRLLTVKLSFLESILWYERDGRSISHVQTGAHEPRSFAPGWVQAARSATFPFGFAISTVLPGSLHSGLAKDEEGTRGRWACQANTFHCLRPPASFAPWASASANEASVAESKLCRQR